VKSAAFVALAATGLIAAAGLAAPAVEHPVPAVEHAARADGPRGPDRDDAAARVQQQEIPYDGRYTFVRVEYDVAGSRSMRGLSGFGRGGRRGEPMWAHDYPRAETNFAKIVSETTLIDPFMDGSRILRMDDPDIFRYPLAYVVEVGYWDANDAEIEALGNYLRKGGFLIVDDFRGPQMYQLEDIFRRAVPELRIMEVPTDHRIFDSFFHIEDPHALAPPTFPQYRPMYLGLFEDNDPTGRLLAILNYNNDIGDYWEYSDLGYYPIDLSNEAYKFGVNYLIYAMTH
jgi:hypothetical protein